MAWDPGCFYTIKDAENVATIQCVGEIFRQLVQAVLALSGVALFVMLIVGGFSFLFSGGDTKKLEQARGTITNAFLGLIIIVAAYLLLRVVADVTGIKDFLQFKIPDISGN